VHFTAVKNQLVIKLEPGDIEIFNNMALFHARNKFKDVDEVEARTIVHDSDFAKRALNGTRHMLRLWLQSVDKELVWIRPEPLKEESLRIYGDGEERKTGTWHVHRAPPINRLLMKHE
jgi:hypothetical protein